ncbi:tRNA dimethylallyltransferase [Polymorphobacter multimanifer]|uniref:tRNA (adenosine(37)-N6)-dimethylallyltransferase MiaA n=1 Tax=Polymorphobacter multimanifer TaxID=1070431 RepID=UPI0019B5112D|nr:tRNA (adenosine(37)-N6)-dimethylallyltransferase MiaA [Polymorphobacter multimanifer]GGI77694.1 tRNA dimethylallyltransferase [Polymorphobacter multimanifer]
MVAVLGGPTASGKSGLALAIAEARPITLINADASQLYADLRLLSARPSAAEEALVPHKLFGILDGAEAATAAHYATLARTAIAETLAEGRLPLLVGGTGLYIEALLHGLAPLPPIDSAIREAVRALPAADAAAALAHEDPAMAARLRPSDTTRLHRALEVIRATGRSLLAWQAAREGGIAETHDVRGIVLLPPRAALHIAAEHRLDAMLAGGALEEVAALIARQLPPDRPVLKALGVASLAAHLAGMIDLGEARARTLFATRQYQKRQSTWMRGRQSGWLHLETADRQAARNAVKL